MPMKLKIQYSLVVAGMGKSLIFVGEDNRSKIGQKQNKRYMEKHLFLGDEAVAQAAIDAGLSGVYAYPGTPSTEITEFIQGSASRKAKGDSLPLEHE